jgi:hypothetical protein
LRPDKTNIDHLKATAEDEVDVAPSFIINA